jgi:hypothetical protein
MKRCLLGQKIQTKVEHGLSDRYKYSLGTAQKTKRQFNYWTKWRPNIFFLKQRFEAYKLKPPQELEKYEIDEQ